MIRRQIVDDAARSSEAGWAFGLGLERLAMVLHFHCGTRSLHLVCLDLRFSLGLHRSSANLMLRKPNTRLPSATLMRWALGFRDR